MKTIIELAREAGFVSAQFWPDDFKGLQASVERFATLVEAAHTERLLAGVEMPEPAGFVWRQAGDKGDPLLTEEKAFTLDQLRETVAVAVAKKDAEIEMLRLQLAACGVAAMQNTEASKSERITRDNTYWSASYGDVCRAVDAEIALRAENERLQAQANERGALAIQNGIRMQHAEAENERLRADADCFNFWVHEAWHSPSAIMKLLNSCETPEDYRNKLLPIMEGRKAAIDAAMKGQP